MALTTDDKQWIKQAMTDGVVEAINEVVIPRFDEVYERFDGIDRRLDGHDEQFTGVNQWLTDMKQ